VNGTPNMAANNRMQKALGYDNSIIIGNDQETPVTLAWHLEWS